MGSSDVRKLIAPTGVALVAALLATAAPGAAQAPAPGDFALRKSNADLQARVDALDARLAKSGVQRLLAEANRNAVHNGPCKAGAFDDIPAGSQWFCFEPDDAGETGGTPEWIPQGITTVADAQADGLWGDRQAILVSWYDDAHEPKKGVRVSFLDPKTRKYRHVLLVYPFFRANGEPAYEIVGRPEGGIHAGGILWYGNYLYVADTRRGLRVFDMRYIFDLANSPDGGSTGDAFGYRYVMPQVGAWVNAAGPDDNDPGNTCSGRGAPKFSYVSLDRSETPDRLITGEYCSTGDLGRVARWPLNGATGELIPQADGRVLATDAYRSAADQIQGAVSYGGTWYLNRSTGRDAGGAWRPGQLIVAKAEGGELRQTEVRAAGVGPEDLSFWPARDELWSLTEHAPNRMLYAVPR
jgi:hypothetical protein